MARNIQIIGGGLIGLALARELHHRGAGERVEVFDCGEPGMASRAAAGMLAARMTAPGPLRDLALASSGLYPAWVEEIERATYLNVGYRPSGTLVLPEAGEQRNGWERLSAGQVAAIEPGLIASAAWLIADDHSVDNRALHAALLADVRARGIPIHRQRVASVSIPAGGIVVNAAGAWASALSAPFAVPVRPRKGQMLCVRTSARIRHVIEAPGVYIVPRCDDRVLIGATLEDVGFDPEVSHPTLAELHRRAAALLPALAHAEWLESWAGYRPCAADELPILGPTPVAGYWLATAHYRDGVLLAPITAHLLADALLQGTPLPAAFSPARFTSPPASGS